ncbi:hypothetical protein Tco_1581268, partial [Tanacetum coccineum]
LRISSEMFKEWIKENFNFEVNFGRTRDDPYSTRFDVYKEECDNKIELLVNEYVLKAGKKRYALDEVWEKCEKFHDTTKLLYDKGFQEEELWQNGIREIDYTPPFSLYESGIRGLLDSFSCGSKVLSGHNHIGEMRLFYRYFARIHLLQSSFEEESNTQGSLLF